MSTVWFLIGCVLLASVELFAIFEVVHLHLRRISAIAGERTAPGTKPPVR